MFILATTDITFDCAVEFLKNLEKCVKNNYCKDRKLRMNITENREWIMNMCDAVLASNEAIHNRTVSEEEKRYEFIKSLCNRLSTNIKDMQDTYRKAENVVKQIRTLEISEAINLLLSNGFDISKKGYLVGNGEDMIRSLSGEEKPKEEENATACIEDDLASPSNSDAEVRVLE